MAFSRIEIIFFGCRRFIRIRRCSWQTMRCIYDITMAPRYWYLGRFNHLHLTRDYDRQLKDWKRKWKKVPFVIEICVIFNAIDNLSPNFSLKLSELSFRTVKSYLCSKLIRYDINSMLQNVRIASLRQSIWKVNKILTFRLFQCRIFLNLLNTVLYFRVLMYLRQEIIENLLYERRYWIVTSLLILSPTLLFRLNFRTSLAFKHFSARTICDRFNCWCCCCMENI